MMIHGLSPAQLGALIRLARDNQGFYDPPEPPRLSLVSGTGGRPCLHRRPVALRLEMVKS
ncbi:MAG: hypothetical protein Kow00104_02240 [Rhodothalassiaceae bacterium]